MLFLVRVEIGTAPPEKAADLLDRIVQEWEFVTALLEAGRIRACGKIARRRGAVAIFDVGSSAELDELIARLPLAPYFARVEVTALIPAADALDSARRRRALLAELLRGRGTPAAVEA